MKILTYKDWKFKIAFDNVIYKDVKRYSLGLNTQERLIMEKEIEFYRNHFSLLQVINHFKKLKTKSEKETFIKAILKRQNNIFYIPNQLKSHFKKMIEKENSDYKDFFLIMLEHACEQRKDNNLIPLQKAILGKDYSKIIRKIKKCAKKPEVKFMQKTLKVEALANSAREIIKELQYDNQLASIYGRSEVRKNVSISVVNDYGYGEWQSKNVSFANDRFFIYSNNAKLTNVGLQHMVFFNVYPGYAHFYNKVVADTTQRRCFDNGATYLINGWAMYAMCHNTGSAYSQNFLIEASYLAKCLLNKNLEKGYEDAYVYLLGKYPKSKAIEYLMDYTQRPGSYLSYVLGEYAIEECINNGFACTPVEFLDNMSTINCGDYFALYNPKMQKKIYNSSVTAKVAKKFAVK